MLECFGFYVLARKKDIQALIPPTTPMAWWQFLNSFLCSCFMFLPVSFFKILFRFQCNCIIGWLDGWMAVWLYGSVAQTKFFVNFCCVALYLAEQLVECFGPTLRLQGQGVKVLLFLEVLQMLLHLRNIAGHNNNEH